MWRLWDFLYYLALYGEEFWILKYISSVFNSSPRTRFRWIQYNYASGVDSWAIDNVVLATGCPWMCSGHGICDSGHCMWVENCLSFFMERMCFIQARWIIPFVPNVLLGVTEALEVRTVSLSFLCHLSWRMISMVTCIQTSGLKSTVLRGETWMVIPSSLEQLSFSKGSEITYIEKNEWKPVELKIESKFSLASPICLYWSLLARIWHFHFSCLFLP